MTSALDMVDNKLEGRCGASALNLSSSSWPVVRKHAILYSDAKCDCMNTIKCTDKLAGADSFRKGSDSAA